MNIDVYLCGKWDQNTLLRSLDVTRFYKAAPQLLKISGQLNRFIEKQV